MSNTLRPTSTILKDNLSYQKTLEKVDLFLKFLCDLEIKLNSANPIFNSYKLKLLGEIKLLKKSMRKHLLNLVDENIDYKTILFEIEKEQINAENIKNKIDAITDQLVQTIFNTNSNSKQETEQVVNSTQEKVATVVTSETPAISATAETKNILVNSKSSELELVDPQLPLFPELNAIATLNNRESTDNTDNKSVAEEPKEKLEYLLTTEFKIQNPLFNETFSLEYKNGDDLNEQTSGLRMVYDQKARNHAVEHLKFTTESYDYVLSGLKAIDEALKQPGIYDTVAATKKAIENYVNSGNNLEYHPFAPGNRENLFNVIEYLRAVSSVSDLPENMLVYKKDFAPFIYGSSTLFDKIVKSYDDYLTGLNKQKEENNTPPVLELNSKTSEEKIQSTVEESNSSLKIPNEKANIAKNSIFSRISTFFTTSLTKIKAKFQKQPKPESTQKPAIENNKKPFFSGSTALATAALAGLSTTFKKVTSIFKKPEQTLTEEQKILQETAKMEKDLISGNSDLSKIGLGALLFSGVAGFLALLGYNTLRTDRAPTSVSRAIASTSSSAPTPPISPSASATTSASSAPVETPAPVPTPPSAGAKTPPTKTIILPNLPKQTIKPTANRKNQPKTDSKENKATLNKPLTLEEKKRIIEDLEKNRNKILRTFEELKRYYDRVAINKPVMEPINTCTPFKKDGYIESNNQNSKYDIVELSKKSIQQIINELSTELADHPYKQPVNELLLTNLPDNVFKTAVQTHLQKHSEHENKIRKANNMIKEELWPRIILVSNAFKSEAIDFVIKDIKIELAILKRRFLDGKNGAITITRQNGSETITATFQPEEQFKEFLTEYEKLKNEFEETRKNSITNPEVLNNVQQKIANLHKNMQAFYDHLRTIEITKRKEAGEKNPEKEAQRACLDESKKQTSQ